MGENMTTHRLAGGLARRVPSRIFATNPTAGKPAG
jgi:hypothetical protein